MTTEMVPYGASGYKYKVVEHGEGSGFESPDFDDSGFSVGSAAFGEPYFEGHVMCDPNATTPPGTKAVNYEDRKTPWLIDTDILLRKKFDLPAGSKNVTVEGVVDNDVDVFLNGKPLDSFQGDGCAIRPNFKFIAPDDLLIAGPNLLAVRGGDDGEVSYLDVKVTADIATAPITAKPVANQPALVRGELVQLDGSQSTGPITTYEWTFSPSASGGCPDGVEPHAEAKKTGPNISVMALCSFTATLTVRDREQNEHSASVEVKVTPRPNWKTSFTQRKQVRQLTVSILTYEFDKYWGRNVCTHDGVNDPDNPNQDSLHNIHKKGGYAKPFPDTSWEGEGYEVGQVNDTGGPFHEMWFVTKNKLHIDRTALVNADLVDVNGKLDRKSKIYQKNKKRGYKDVKAVVDSTIDHEQMHSTMIREALDKLKKEGKDPAKKIEEMFDTEKKALLKKVNQPILDAESVLQTAALNHTDLCPRLKKWHRPATILLPTYDDRDKYKPYYIPNLACKGGDYQFTTP